MSDGGRRWLLRIADAARTIIRLSRKQPFVPSPKVGSARHVNRGETKAPGGEVCPTGRRPPNPTLTGGCEVRVPPGGDTRKCPIPAAVGRLRHGISWAHRDLGGRNTPIELK